MLRTAPIWTALLLWSAPALADDNPTQKVQTAKGDPDAHSHDGASVMPDDPSTERAAAAAYEKALASYAKGDVVAALERMRESYQLSQRAELLYNLAELEQELNACADSLTDYRRYLELVPHGRYRESAERARARLEAECPAPTAAPTALVSASDQPGPAQPPSKQLPTSVEQASYWTAPRVIGWSAIATGTLAGIGALYFQLEAIEAKDDYQQSVDRAQAGGSSPDQSLEDRQHRNNHLAIAFGVTGGAMVLGGALLLLLDPGSPPQQTRSAYVYALPGLIGGSYAQHF